MDSDKIPSTGASSPSASAALAQPIEVSWRPLAPGAVASEQFKGVRTADLKVDLLTVRACIRENAGRGSEILCGDFSQEIKWAQISPDRRVALQKMTESLRGALPPRSL